jgi:hypothetical protein
MREKEEEVVLQEDEIQKILNVGKYRVLQPSNPFSLSII